jgi:hypothetical protein
MRARFVQVADIGGAYVTKIMLAVAGGILLDPLSSYLVE